MGVHKGCVAQLLQHCAHDVGFSGRAGIPCAALVAGVDAAVEDPLAPPLSAFHSWLADKMHPRMLFCSAINSSPATEPRVPRRHCTSFTQQVVTMSPASAGVAWGVLILIMQS